LAEILSRMDRDKAGAFEQILGKIGGYMVTAGGRGCWAMPSRPGSTLQEASS